MRKFHVLILLFSPFLFNACQKDQVDERDTELDNQLETVLKETSNGEGKSFYTLPESYDLSAIPSDPKNPLTEEKVDLGMYLFFETGLSMSPMKEASLGTYACASCHIPTAGFTAGRVQAIADGGIGMGRNGEGRIKSAIYAGHELDAANITTPSLLNGAYNRLKMANGMFGSTDQNEGTEALWTWGPLGANNLGFHGLETQAIAGLVGHRLAHTKEFIQNIPAYKQKYDDVFKDTPEEERYSLVNTGLALGAWQRTLIPNQAPFQKWLKGDETAMTDMEKKGALLFFGKANCTTCHNGKALNSMEFHALGMNDMYMNEETIYNTSAEDPFNLGRMSFSQDPADAYKFKVPQLYNLEDNPFYGHGSSFRTIKDVVNYYNNAVPQNVNVPSTQLAAEFKPLGLSEEEVDQLTSFLTHALRDQNLERYTPDAIPSGNCFPFNDPVSKAELNCY